MLGFIVRDVPANKNLLPKETGFVTLRYFAFFAALGAAAAERFLNFSMRPAVSETFSLPVKSGWHCEQISISIDSRVEPTVTVAPQAHVAFAAG